MPAQRHRQVHGALRPRHGRGRSRRYLRTWHDGWHGIPAETLFDLAADHRCERDLAGDRPGPLDRGRALLAAWRDRHRTPHGDPLDEVLDQGGPQMVRGRGPAYRRRLRDTGRSEPPGARR